MRGRKARGPRLRRAARDRAAPRPEASCGPGWIAPPPVPPLPCRFHQRRRRPPPPEALPVRIKSMRVRNLRAVRDCTLTLGGLTALVGANGTGKSTFLYALGLFQGTESAGEEDYYNRDTSRDIEIQITFACLRDSARNDFSAYIENGELCVACTIRWTGAKAVTALRPYSLSNTDIDAVLDAPDEASARALHARLLESRRCRGLPGWSGLAKTKRRLREWKSSNPDRCSVRYGAEDLFVDMMAGQIGLAGHVWFHLVPAVRDAAGAARGGRGPVLAELLEAIAARANAGAAGGAGPAGGRRPPEMDRLEGALRGTLARFAPGSGVDIECGAGHGPGRPGLRTAPRLVEGGYSSPVGLAGHGLQRALIAAAGLHQLPHMQAPGLLHAGAPSPDPPTVVLAIEEPEIHQHPTRTRHLAALLRALPDKGLDGVAGDIQVLYTTHSPQLVFADRIDQIRLVRKSNKGTRDGEPAAAEVASTTSADILDDLKRHGAASRADESIDQSLLRLMGPAASEGLFAETVVLVEGPSDRVALAAAAEIMGRPLDSLGVSIVACGSKAAMPLPLALFRRLGVRVYPVWDADKNKGKQRKESERILGLIEYGDWDWHGKIGESFACLEVNLEETICSDLKRALGEEAGADPYKTILDRRLRLHGFARIDSKILKTHLVMEEVGESGLRLETLESIVRQITGPCGGNAA